MLAWLKRIGAGKIFLFVVAIAYLVVAVVEQDAAVDALGAFWNLFLQVLPVLAIVYGLLFLSNLFITSDLVLKYLGGERRIGGWIIAIISGIISSGPIYLWYPLLGDLKEKGMRTSLVACFLYNRAVKIPLLPMMILYFGPKLVIVLTVCMVGCSILNGLIVEWFTSDRAAG